MRPLLIFLLSMTLIFAQGNSPEKSAEVSQPALVDVSVKTTYEVYTNAEIFTGYPELLGRKYVLSNTKSTKGAFVSSDGIVLVDASVQEKNPENSRAPETLLDLMIKDAARVAHIKMFGIEPSDSEIDSFAIYLLDYYGGRESLVLKINSAYKEGKIIFVPTDSLTTTGSPEGNLMNATVIYSDSNVAVINTTVSDAPTLAFLNGSNVTNGDTGYLITYVEPDNPIITPVFIESSSSSDSGISFAVPPSSTIKDEYGKYFNLITDKTGNVIGVELGENGKNIIDSNELKALEKSANFEHKVSDTNAFFLEGIDSYEEGVYDKAEESFEKVLTLYPEHLQAKNYLNKTAEAEKKKNPLGSLKFENLSIPENWIFILVFGVALFYLVTKIFFRK
ncbi:hypothetical protein HYT84_03990 [Candidatus Micrarchaeota archaeon]|nr:hypothetical protein [Candidatus Micrarchaeota archaeon]